MTDADKTHGIPRVSQGISRVSSGVFSHGDTLHENGTFQRVDASCRVSQGIHFLKKDGQGAGSDGRGAQGRPPLYMETDTLDTLYPPKNAGNKPTQPKKKATRRLKKRAETVANWWASLPEPRPFFFTPAQLTEALRPKVRHLPTALEAAGWTRIRRTINCRPGTYWLPPGSPIAAWPPYTARHFACP